MKNDFPKKYRKSFIPTPLVRAPKKQKTALKCRKKHIILLFSSLALLSLATFAMLLFSQNGVWSERESKLRLSNPAFFTDEMRMFPGVANFFHGGHSNWNNVFYN